MSHSAYYFAKQKVSIGVTQLYQILYSIFFYESLRKGLLGKKKTYTQNMKEKIGKPVKSFRDIE